MNLGRLPRKGMEVSKIPEVPEVATECSQKRMEASAMGERQCWEAMTGSRKALLILFR